MATSKQLGEHLHNVYFGGNWTASNIKDSLSAVTYDQATKKIENCNTILDLTYHIHYFVNVAIPVFKGQPLDAHDKYSFDHPGIKSEVEWRSFVSEVLETGKKLAKLISEIDDAQLDEPFYDPKYGTYYSNMWGTIEHCHYHLGQINVLRKVV